MRFRMLALGILGGIALSAGRAAAPSAEGIPVTEGLPDMDLEADRLWDLEPPPLAETAPDYDLHLPATRGLPANVAEWQKATVIVLVSGGFGSGAIIAPDGWVLTNYHVVEGPLQEAATTGKLPVVVSLVTCVVDDRGPHRRVETVPARIYRADPTRDLALLKIEGKAPGAAWPHFNLHRGPVEVQSECFAVGSQGGGLPWAVRRGNVSILGQYPFGFTEFVVGAMDTAQVAGLRQRLDMIITSCEISSGDSGGPLVNGQGQLIGLTFATPANLSTGAVGFHVAATEIADFLEPMPKLPEESPFDSWMGGVAAAAHGQPRIGVFKVENQEIQALQLPVIQARGGSYVPVANALYIDFQNRNGPAPGENPNLVIPAGLWGMGDRGGFQFDAFVVCRADSVVAVGYVDGNRGVDEIRIDRNRDGWADHRWRRELGKWRLEPCDGPSTPLADAKRVGASGTGMIESILNGCKQ